MKIMNSPPNHSLILHSHYYHFAILYYNNPNNYTPMYKPIQHWNINNTSSDIVISYNYMFYLYVYLLCYLLVLTDPLLSRYDLNDLIGCNIHNMHIMVYTFFLLKNIHSTFSSSLSFYMYIHFLCIFSFSQPTMFPSKTPLKSTTPKNPLQ